MGRVCGAAARGPEEADVVCHSYLKPPYLAREVVRRSSSLPETHSNPLRARFCRALRHCAPVDHLPDHLWR